MSTASRRRATAIFPHEITASREFLDTTNRGPPTLAHLPALILRADRDVAFRATERERWEGLPPNHTTVPIHGAGHYLPSDAPEAFATAIADWHLP